jgi:dTDP-L-rhamnose 4-epimerase
MLIDSLADGEIEPQVVGKYRRGDIRHCFADIAKIGDRLGFAPQVSFEEGVSDLIGWVREQEAADRFLEVDRELMDKELIV